jgi:hypothetical protein
MGEKIAYGRNDQGAPLYTLFTNEDPESYGQHAGDYISAPRYPMEQDYNHSWKGKSTDGTKTHGSKSNTELPRPSKQKNIERPCANFISQAQDSSYSDILMNLYVLHPNAENSLWKNTIFIAQLLEFIFSMAQFIISGLVITAEIEINHYYYLIISVILLLVLLAVHGIGITEWQQQPSFSHTHLNDIFISFFLWIFLSLANSVMLGVWLQQKEDSTCCSFSDSQPSMSPPYSNEYTQFLVIYGTIFASSLVIMVSISRALVAHYTPEYRFNPPRYIADAIKDK